MERRGKRMGFRLKVRRHRLLREVPFGFHRHMSSATNGLPRFALCTLSGRRKWALSRRRKVSRRLTFPERLVLRSSNLLDGARRRERGAGSAILPGIVKHWCALPTLAYSRQNTRPAWKGRGGEGRERWEGARCDGGGGRDGWLDMFAAARRMRDAGTEWVRLFHISTLF